MEYITKIRTDKGDLSIDYLSLAHLPHSDVGLDKSGEFADSKAVGDALKSANESINNQELHIKNYINNNFVNKSITVNGKSLSTNISLDYNDIQAVPNFRTVNGLQLSSDIELKPQNIGSVDKNGDVMSGNLDFSEGYTVSGIRNPINQKDAANKQYVDSQINNQLSNKIIFKENINVNSSMFSEIETSSPYRMRGAIPVSGVTGNMFASVSFDNKEAESGNFSANCDTYSGGIHIYAMDVPENSFNIPTILLIKKN